MHNIFINALEKYYDFSKYNNTEFKLEVQVYYIIEI